MNTKTLDKEQHDLHTLTQDQRYIGHSTERPSLSHAQNAKQPPISAMAAPNHWYSVNSQITRTRAKEYLPQPAPFTHWPAPRMTKNRPNEACAGKREGEGTK